MSSSQQSGQPTILRCPHCGAPLQAAPYAHVARCNYCGNDVQLARPSAQPPASPPYAPPARPPAPWPAPAPAPTAASPSPLALVLIAFAVMAVVGASVAGYLVTRPADSTADGKAPTPTFKDVDPASAPVKPSVVDKRAASATVKYPMRALLGINPAIDIDGSRAHMQALFPGIVSAPQSNELQFELPLGHPWFSKAKLNWANEKNGKLVSVGFFPESGSDKLKNQKEISDCLAKTLGKPTVQEIDHLAGQVNYFFGSRFPKAHLSVYDSYVWMRLENPLGAAPVTLANVVRTLDGCAPVP